ncbi:MAG: primosomal protein N' [Pelagibacteraceae bacterium TMED216]|nr:MAG: primosomal protein N' [Pelagibacteraceae bacterium TMED216]|tara:strand:- start:5994 stop:8444 length:2451 start_codon:yes stop_codon:yes gene_type:complete
MQYFADVLLPLALGKPFTYAITPEDYGVLKPGFRVAVSFGKSKVYTGVVVKLHKNPPQRYTPKFIEMLMEDSPIVTPKQLEFWEWLSKYYQSKLGDILRAALPTTFLLESETIVVRKEISEDDKSELNDDAFLVYEALEVKALSIKEIIEILGKKSVLGVLNNMFTKGVVDIHQKLNEKYKPRLVRYIRLSNTLLKNKNFEGVFDSLRNAPMQKHLLMGVFDQNPQGDEWKKAKELLKKTGSGSSAMKGLIEKGILEEQSFQQDRLLYDFKKINPVRTLSEAQKAALDKIISTFEDKSVVLFQGVTGSGKTEVYIELINRALERGQQVLYLLPEISLTPQMVRRLQERFGPEVTVYHSKFSIHERTEVWRNILEKKPNAKIIVGTRSALFLPFNDLGLIVVDEEHELSYKQFDPSPRYNARDSAVVLAGIHLAKVLLGSATPAVESSFNHMIGKYGWVKLRERYGQVALPEIMTVDLKSAYKKKQLKGGFSKILVQEIEQTLAMGKQIILFQNQRGYAPVLECLDCGHMPQCHQCDVTLTYHQYSDQLKCHYCDYHIAVPKKCYACGLTNLSTKGMGTQKIEEEVAELFPMVKVARMDWDTTRGKWAFDKLIDSFASQEIKILVGTQMIIKGLDFQNVHLVGVLNADHLLNFPDFRAHERTFQMLSQVAGRAGRKDVRGKVLIQTYQPNHAIIQQVIDGDYKKMLEQQLKDRKEYYYPPFARLIRIVVNHRDMETVKKASQWIVNVLLQSEYGQVLGPVFPSIARVRNRYRMQIMVKITSDKSRERVKQIIQKTLEGFVSISQFRACRVNLDVDPY